MNKKTYHVPKRRCTSFGPSQPPASAVVGLRWPVLVLVGRRWPALVGVGLRWPTLAFVGLRSLVVNKYN
jgi:hypothetical protein